MRMKLLALASVAMLAIGTGGVIATDQASTDGVQFQNDAVPSNVDEGVGDGDTHEEPDQKFSAEELERTNLSDADIEMEFVDDDKGPTADELELRPHGIASNDDGTTVMTFEEPSEVSVTSNTTSAGA